MGLLPSKESLTIEFKSDRKGYSDSDIYEAVVAFANTKGGDLYLGIENSGEVTGLNEMHRNPYLLSAKIANNTVPPVPVRSEIINDSKPVLKITVPQSFSGIVATKSGKVLRRQIKMDGEPENIPMYPSEYSTRLSDLRLMDYSAMPLYDTTVDDFDPVELEHLRNIIVNYHGDRSLLELTNEELFKALGFVRAQGSTLIPTVTGILLIGKIDVLERFLPAAKSVFQVLQGTEVKMNEDINAPILKAIESIFAYINAWNPEKEIEMGLFRMSVPEFDKRAVREGIVNAFVHRDYTKIGNVRVAIDDDKLLISNPGGFVEGVSIENLLTAEPRGRNPMLADALKRIGLAERTGRGIDRIFEGSLIYGKALPDYTQSTSVSVTLLIPRSQPDVQIAKIVSDEQNRLGRPLDLNPLLVLNALRDNPKSTAEQLAEECHLNKEIVTKILNEEIESGLIDPYGKGRSRTYMLAPNVYSTKEQTIGYVRQKDIDESRYHELIINLAQNNEYISRADVVQLLHVNQNKAYQLLRTLTKNGELELVNKGHYAKYRLKKR
jgi:ATP-dependent DNA helicase RecG